MFTSSPPAPFLADCVDAFWERSGGGTARILPDGCMDFIFDLERGTARLVGTMTCAKIVPGAPETRLFGVRFRPGVAARYLAAHPRDLVDRVAPLADVTNGDARFLSERIAEARTPNARRSVIADHLSCARSRIRPAEPRIRMATRLLQAHHGQLNITALAAEIGVSERQLERLFHERLGVTPKHYARVVRLEHAISQLPHFGTQADVAAATGYADESHLLRDFRALTGVTPTQLIAERRL